MTEPLDAFDPFDADKRTHHPDYDGSWASPWSKWHVEYDGAPKSALPNWMVNADGSVRDVMPLDQIIHTETRQPWATASAADIIRDIRKWRDIYRNGGREHHTHREITFDPETLGSIANVHDEYSSRASTLMGIPVIVTEIAKPGGIILGNDLVPDRGAMVIAMHPLDEIAIRAGKDYDKRLRLVNEYFQGRIEKQAAEAIARIDNKIRELNEPGMLKYVSGGKRGYSHSGLRWGERDVTSIQQMLIAMGGTMDLDPKGRDHAEQNRLYEEWRAKNLPWMEEFRPKRTLWQRVTDRIARWTRQDRF